MSDDGAIQVRSYGVCFAFERRIQKFDHWRIPLPYGIPVRGILYFAALLILVLVLSRVPLLGGVIGALHPSLRFVVLPIGLAAALTRYRVDGRSAHQAGLAWLRLRAQPNRVVGFRTAPAPGVVRLGQVALAHDERTARMRKGVVEGPARVVLRYPVETTSLGRVLRVKQSGDDHLWRGKQVDLAAGQRLVVR